MTWFKNNSYAIVKMMIYQFGVAILGIILTFATIEKDNLMLMVSIYTVAFYILLLYTMTWEIGAKERIRADAGLVRFDRFDGLKLSLCANIPNFLILLLYFIGFLFGVVLAEHGWAQGMVAVMHTVGIVWESMYTGIIRCLIPDTASALSGWYVLAYALTPLPALLTSCFGYLMGSHNKRIFGKLTEKKKP
ncbi:MAG: hypothetical protein IJ012_01580 [Clostridia bacterium]|nr:hypothetical protein [Clostridia bacterium]